MDITDRLADKTELAAIAAADSGAADQAFATLTRGLPNNQVVMAYWTKFRSSVRRSWPIRSGRDLIYVVAGVRAHGCTKLSFRAIPKQEVPGSHRHLSYEACHDALFV